MSILCQNMRTGNDNDFWNSGDPIFRRPQTGKRGNFGPLWEEVKNNMSQSFGIYLLIWRDQAQQEE